MLLPLLPLSFPVVWIFLNLYGVARIKAVFYSLRQNSKVSSSEADLVEFVSCVKSVECGMEALGLYNFVSCC